jgi:hypothetical protein
MGRPKRQRKPRSKRRREYRAAVVIRDGVPSIETVEIVRVYGAITVDAGALASSG